MDDEEIVRTAQSTVLEKMGYRVLEAADGLEAVEVFKKRGKEIDLVVLDIAMPVMDGEETFKMLKALDPEVQVLVASAYSQEGKVARILNSGAKDFIQKPFDLESLAYKIRKILG